MTHPEPTTRTDRLQDLPRPEYSQIFTSALLAARSALQTLERDAAAMQACATLAQRASDALKAGRKILTCGNGGSMADAMHFAEELTGRFRLDRPALAAIACSDPTHLTCTANDYGFEHVFSRWVEALGQPGDLLIVLSTSGNSPNIAKAVAAAKSRGLHTAALLGRGGGTLKGAASIEIIVPGETSDRIQELHMLILHALVEAIEAGLLKSR